ncbi:hypothetical protein RB195_021448 [Necator americanus]|uniref:EF-hand domain-containing protein n=1 Tax=Necator americanus TaxID=51031 RepID=A0ABR1EB16_NECAM
MIFQKEESGKICKEEFVRYMRCPPVHRTTLKELETQFHNFDSDGDGSITEDNAETVHSETENHCNLSRNGSSSS